MTYNICNVVGVLSTSMDFLMALIKSNDDEQSKKLMFSRFFSNDNFFKKFVKMHVLLVWLFEATCVLFYSVFFSSTQKIEVPSYYKSILHLWVFDASRRRVHLFFTFEFSTTLLTFRSHNYKNHIKTNSENTQCTVKSEEKGNFGRPWTVCLKG